MIKQPLALVGEVWTCAWCAAGIRNSGIVHKDDCRWIDEIRDEDSVHFYEADAPGLGDESPEEG